MAGETSPINQYSVVNNIFDFSRIDRSEGLGQGAGFEDAQLVEYDQRTDGRCYLINLTGWSISDKWNSLFGNA